MTSTPRSEGASLEGEVGDSEVKLAVGVAACVWNQYLRRWTSGFAVAEALASGYRLRRLSDDYVFSHVFSTDEVMEERRKTQEPGVYGTRVDRRRATPGSDASLR
jgi:hypothetical protein